MCAIHCGMPCSDSLILAVSFGYDLRRRGVRSDAIGLKEEFERLKISSLVTCLLEYGVHGARVQQEVCRRLRAGHVETLQ